MRHSHLVRFLCGTTLLLSAALGQDQDARINKYVQTNLVSDVSGLAAHTDANLVNAWGIAFRGAGPWWVNANGTGLSLVYDSAGNPNPPGHPLIVTVPPPAGGSPPSTPTGIVANTTSDFQIMPGQPGFFLFDTEDGTISGWNPSADATHALLKVTTPNAVFKGLTMGQISGQNVLYAANFRNATVDVFDGKFNSMTLAPGAFQDPILPSGYAPFSVQNIGGSIFVAFAKQDDAKHDEVDGPGLGYVTQFTADGTLVMRLQHGDWMNAPWGMVMAPAFGFGQMSRRILVGQFGSGQIASFNANTGKFEGMMLDQSGQTLTIDGLWALRFGNGSAAGPVHSLFFSAGIQGEAHGLFGTLTIQ